MNAVFPFLFGQMVLWSGRGDGVGGDEVSTCVDCGRACPFLQVHAISYSGRGHKLRRHKCIYSLPSSRYLFLCFTVGDQAQTPLKGIVDAWKTIMWSITAQRVEFIPFAVTLADGLLFLRA